MKSSRISNAIVSHFIRSVFLVQWITITVVSSEVDVVNEKLPTAAKLTISIDSVTPSLPPQIAYFIPDSALNNFLNRTMLNGAAFNRTVLPWRPPPRQPVTPAMMPMPNSDFDSMASPQSNYRYVVVPKNHNRKFVAPNYDAVAAYQNYNYDIDYKGYPEKKPNFWRFQTHEDEAYDTHGSGKTKKKTVKRPAKHTHKFLNYNPTSIRQHLSSLKKNHRDHFSVDDDDDDTADDSERIIDGRVNGKKIHKKTKVNRKKPRVPTSSYENEDRLPPYYSVAAAPHHDNHKNCDHESEENGNSDALEVDGGDYDDGVQSYPIQTSTPSKRKKSRGKGFTFYITKVHDPNTNTERMLRIGKVQKNDDADDAEDMATDSAFVPTRFLSSVRGIEKTVYMKKHRTPSKPRKPRVKERLMESGGHVVYTEDGYEDKDYDHGSQEKYVRYHRRNKRETLPEPSELKGQELIDHLSNLIKNASDTLESVDGELQGRRRYPFYNSSKSNVKQSSIRYAEHDEPFRANEANSYYDTKLKKCNEIADDVQVTSDTPDSVVPTKRLNNLGTKIDCVKEKLFGENPLDNPIFDEEDVSQPAADVVFNSDSSVYSDIMHNIGYNGNQRVFSNFGISDNYDVSAVDSLSVKHRPENSLNTNEKDPHEDKSDEEDEPDTRGPSNSQKNYNNNPFNNPSQVPILDISQFIPRPHPYFPASPLFESDFLPVTTTTGRTTITHAAPPITRPLPVEIPVIVPAVATSFYRQRRQPPRKNAGHNQNRFPPNVIVLRRGQTMAIVRIIPPNKPR